jgi:hypothetical protein
VVFAIILALLGERSSATLYHFRPMVTHSVPVTLVNKVCSDLLRENIQRVGRVIPLICVGQAFGVRTHQW